jgi:hypothetical protein
MAHLVSELTRPRACRFRRAGLACAQSGSKQADATLRYGVDIGAARLTDRY